MKNKYNGDIKFATIENAKLTYEKVPASTLEKSFTTERKFRKSSINISRKGSIVKERCQQLIDIALEMFPDRVLTDEDLTFLIARYIGADKETVRAYKGYSGHIRAGRCGDNKIVGLSRKGYLELMDFVHRVSGRRWVIHAQSVLSYIDKDCSGSGVGSKENISLSLLGGGCVVEGSVLGSENGSSRTLEEDSEKERNLCPKIYPKILETAEKLILTAPVATVEPDHSKIKWPKQEPNIKFQDDFCGESAE